MGKKKNTSGNPGKVRPIRVRGASYIGRYTVILLTSGQFEVRTLSTALIITVFVFMALLFGAISLVINNWIFSIFSIILGGVFGYMLMTQYYNGKRLFSFSYSDIVSFVFDPPEFTLNLKDTRMISLRMMPKKQKYLLECVEEAMAVTGEYHLKKVGGYYKIRTKNQDPTAED